MKLEFYVLKGKPKADGTPAYVSYSFEDGMYQYVPNIFLASKFFSEYDAENTIEKAIEDGYLHWANINLNALAIHRVTLEVEE